MFGRVTSFYFQETTPNFVVCARTRTHNKKPLPKAVGVVKISDPSSTQGVQAYDRFAYVSNNPVRYTDPTGHSIDCAVGEQDCLVGKRVPSWWRSPKEHIYIDGYGYFDTGHIRRGWNSGNYLINLKLEENGRDFPMQSGNYSVQYSVSENVTEEQIDGVLYGIYTDFEYGYEQHQGKRWDFLSSFTPEDLPSDHVGFWAAMVV